MSDGHLETRVLYTVVDYHGYTATVWWFGIVSQGKVRVQFGNRRDKAIALLDKLRKGKEYD